MHHLFIRLVIGFSVLCSASACQEMGKGSRMATETATQSVKDTADALERVFTYKPQAEEYAPIPYTFCYQVLQDINCYNQPMPDARGRLVGWQGRGEFHVEDPMKLPAKTALVRQPRPEEKYHPIEKILKPEPKQKPELVALEPVEVPEPPKVSDDKVVTIKVSNPTPQSLY